MLKDDAGWQGDLLGRSFSVGFSFNPRIAYSYREPNGALQKWNSGEMPNITQQFGIEARYFLGNFGAGLSISLAESQSGMSNQQPEGFYGSEFCRYHYYVQNTGFIVGLTRWLTELSLLFRLPLNRGLTFQSGAGLIYEYLSWSDKVNERSGFMNSFGVHLSVGAEYFLLSNISISLACKWQYWGWYQMTDSDKYHERYSVFGIKLGLHYWFF